MSEFDIATAETPKSNLLLRRIMIREKLRVQVQFLDHLFRIPACRGMVLHGGAALHGVHLHKRLSEDLDLVGSPSMIGQFRPLLAAHGMALEEREGMEPAYTCPGVLGIPIGIGVDLRGRLPEGIGQECLPFGFLIGYTVPVPVPPLADMLAEKLDCVTRRAQAVDFLDLWLSFRREPALVEAAFLASQARKTNLIYDPATAREHLEQVHDKWEERLQPLMLRVPNYAEVQHDLELWLL